MIRNILYSICLHLLFLIAIYSSIKNIDFSDQDQAIEGISVGVKELDEKKKLPAEKPPEPEKEKEFVKPAEKKEEEPKKQEPEIKNEPKKKTEQDVKLPPAEKKEIKKIIKKIEKKLEKKEDIPDLTIRKVYQNDTYTDSVDSLDLSSIHTRSIKNHLNFCFASILEGQDKSLEMVEEIEVIFDVSKSGVIKFDFKRNADEKLLKDQKFANYQEIIRKIENSTKNCAIFRNLPSDKYEIWREFKVLLTSKK